MSVGGSGLLHGASPKFFLVRNGGASEPSAWGKEDRSRGRDRRTAVFTQTARQDEPCDSTSLEEISVQQGQYSAVDGHACRRLGVYGLLCLHWRPMSIYIEILLVLCICIEVDVRGGSVVEGRQARRWRRLSLR